MATADSTSKRSLMIGLGIGLAIVGLVAASVLWMVAGSRRTDAIEELARAPIGCDTTLDFDEPGEYFIFVETAGRIDDVRGDCDAEGEFDVDEPRPDVDVTVIDPDGKELDLDGRRDDVTYSTDGFVGRSILSIDVEDAADHVMRVESADGSSFAVAVGRDPGAGVAALRIGALVAAVLGVIGGLLIAIFGARRRAARAPTSASSGAWTPGQPGQFGHGGQFAQPAQPRWGPAPTGVPFAPPSQPPYRQPEEQFDSRPNQPAQPAEPRQSAQPDQPAQPRQPADPGQRPTRLGGSFAPPTGSVQGPGVPRIPGQPPSPHEPPRRPDGSDESPGDPPDPPN